MAPTWIVGSRPASIKQRETLEVVVVFPWVPETPIVLRYILVIYPTKSPLSTVGILFSLAANSSGSSCFIAAE